MPQAPLAHDTDPAAGVGAVHGAAAVERLMRPRSVAIVGMSARPGSAGQTSLANFVVNGYRGDIHLVGRGGGEIEGRPLLASVDLLPEEIDLAILTVPAAAVEDAVAGLIRRRAHSAVVFAAGFAELSAEGAAAQAAIAERAAAGGLALLGPNCLGFANFADGIAVSIFGGAALPRLADGERRALAVVGQSGGLIGHLRVALEARGLPISHSVTTGNEAGLGLADFIDFLAGDAATQVIVVYAEHVRRAGDFLVAAARARRRGKAIVMLHPGRSSRAQAAARSHTGALAGDYAVMRTQVEHSGIVLVDTLEELVDVGEILARFPTPPTAGVGIVTFSGAFCGIAHDFCEDVGLDIPPLSPSTVEFLRPKVPVFAPPNNPLDLTTQPAWEPDLLGLGARALLDDPAIGSLVISVTLGASPHSLRYLDGLLPLVEGETKPMVFVGMGDGSPLLPEFLTRVAASPMAWTRSSERALRAMARVTAYGRRLAARYDGPAPAPFAGLPALGQGPQPEWLGKKVLATIGVAVPQGELAASVEEALAAAGRIGYPVVLKAQSAALEHKTEAGGVAVGIAGAEALRRAWQTLLERVGAARPDITLDGVLVEAMAAPGVELVVGARRDPDWGPVLLVGLGGIWIEALGDVRLLPVDLPEAAIADELGKLRAAKLLGGFRGSPPVDVAAVARAAAAVGRLMQTAPEIIEIDINPLVAHPLGAGATALDALVVTR